MQRTRPLPDTHPEFSFLECRQYREYRVANKKLLDCGTSCRNAAVQLCFGIMAAFAWASWTTCGLTRHLGIVTIITLLARILCTGLIYESVTIFPLHGIQLETHRGLLWWELSKTQTFLPFSIFQDLFINEALFGWNVRYYIAAKVQRQKGDYHLHVAFPDTLPHYPILQKVYSDIQDFLPPRK